MTSMYVWNVKTVVLLKTRGRIGYFSGESAIFRTFCMFTIENNKI